MLNYVCGKNVYVSTMKSYKNKVIKTAEFLKASIEKLPEIGLMTGTSLEESAKSLDLSASFEYKDIPHFPISTVEEITVVAKEAAPRLETIVRNVVETI